MSSFLSLRVLFPSSPQKAWFSWLGWVCSSLPVYLPSGSLCLSLPSRSDVAIILQLSSPSVTGSQAFICSKGIASFDFYFFLFLVKLSDKNVYFLLLKLYLAEICTILINVTLMCTKCMFVQLNVSRSKWQYGAVGGRTSRWWQKALFLSLWLLLSPDDMKK